MTTEEKYLEFLASCGFEAKPVDYMREEGMSSYNFIPEYHHTYIVFYADTGKFSMTVTDGELDKYSEHPFGEEE